MRQSDASIVHTSAQLKGRRLRMARALTGFSRQELFERIGIAISTIDTWESGRVELSQKSAERICSALKRVGVSCSVQWLLTGCGNPPRIMDIVEKTMIEVGSLNNTDIRSRNFSENREKHTRSNHISDNFNRDNYCNDKKINQIADSKIRHELSFFLSIHNGALFHVVDEDFLNSQYKTGDCVAGVKENVQSLVGKTIIAELKNSNEDFKTILCKVLSYNKDGSCNVFINFENDNEKVEILNAAEVVWHRMLKKKQA